MDKVGAVCLDEIRKARRAADAGDGADFLVPDLSFLDELIIEGEDGEVAAAGAPGWVIGGGLFFRQPFAIGIEEVGHRNAVGGRAGEGEGRHGENRIYFLVSTSTRW